MDRLRILLVDDEEELVFTLAERLQLRDFEALAVTTGKEALESFDDRIFDVVVLDVKMPGMDGLELMKRIKQRSPTSQVILLTGRGSAGECERALKEGAYDYLMKPVKIEVLIRKMKEAAGGTEE